MNVVDVFCGTKSVSSVFLDRGHDVLTIDWDKQHQPDIRDNVLNISADDILSFYGWDSVDFIHLSPDCTTYSIAAISTHRYPDGRPKTDKAILADKVRVHIMKLLVDLKPRYFTIENPVGMFRKMPEIMALSRKYFHAKVTYYKYGDTRMKPTDIWHNVPTLRFRPPCKNGSSCHESAPRGSKTGTQGRKDSVERSMIPYELCFEICKAVEAASRSAK